METYSPQLPTSLSHPIALVSGLLASPETMHWDNFQPWWRSGSRNPSGSFDSHTWQTIAKQCPSRSFSRLEMSASPYQSVFSYYGEVPNFSPNPDWRIVGESISTADLHNPMLFRILSQKIPALDLSGSSFHVWYLHVFAKNLGFSVVWYAGTSPTNAAFPCISPVKLEVDVVEAERIPSWPLHPRKPTSHGKSHDIALVWGILGCFDCGRIWSPQLLHFLRLEIFAAPWGQGSQDWNQVQPANCC